MLNLKNEKGSITLFVLVSCMFFIASVACVQMYMQSKQVAVDREYRQIKSNYEANSVDDASMKEAYEQLAQVKNLSINIEKTTEADSKLYVEFTLNTTNLNAKTIKYGWGTSTSIDTVSDWIYVENESVNNKMLAVNENVSTSGDYHLFVVVDGKEAYTEITV